MPREALKPPWLLVAAASSLAKRRPTSDAAPDVTLTMHGTFQGQKRQRVGSREADRQRLVKADREADAQADR